MIVPPVAAPFRQVPWRVSSKVTHEHGWDPSLAHLFREMWHDAPRRQPLQLLAIDLLAVYPLPVDSLSPFPLIIRSAVWHHV